MPWFPLLTCLSDDTNYGNEKSENYCQGWMNCMFGYMIDFYSGMIFDYGKSYLGVELILEDLNANPYMLEEVHESSLVSACLYHG